MCWMLYLGTSMMCTKSASMSLSATSPTNSLPVATAATCCEPCTMAASLYFSTTSACIRTCLAFPCSRTMTWSCPGMWPMPLPFKKLPLPVAESAAPTGSGTMDLPAGATAAKASGSTAAESDALEAPLPRMPLPLPLAGGRAQGSLATSGSSKTARPQHDFGEPPPRDASATKKEATTWTSGLARCKATAGCKAAVGRTAWPMIASAETSGARNA
mmetsp:Transcript_35530/g.115044  ORF Transcript_35530/g.115044 Transcript_35530/m.115044 type:complete len:216 (-) Transcript_35530:171-818(-)